MKNTGTSIKTVCNVILGIMLVLSIIAIALFAYYFKNPPNTQKTLYANALTFAEENAQGEKPYPIEINFFSNEKKNGIHCTELKFNYYTDTTIPTSDDEYKFVYSSGVQLFDDFRALKRNDNRVFAWSIDEYIDFVNARYYNSVYGQSYSAISKLSPSDNWIMDYSMKTTDEQGQEKISHNLAKIFQRGATFHDRGVFGIKNYYVYDVNRLIVDLLTIVSRLDSGVYITPFDMSNYFDYKIYNQETKQFESITSDDQDCFVSIKITKTDNGLVRANQSLYNQIDYNADYAYDGVVAKDYAEARAGYILTESDFVVLDNELYLKERARKYLVNFPKMYLQVVLDLDNLESCSGFSKDIFSSLDVLNISLTATRSQKFYVYEDYTILSNNVTIKHKGGDT